MALHRLVAVSSRRPLTIAVATYLVLLVAGALAFVVSPSVRIHLHPIAALLTFACFGVVAATGD